MRDCYVCKPVAEARNSQLNAVLGWPQHENSLFYFTFKSGSVPNRRPSPLPKHNLFLHCLPPRLKNNIGDAGFEEMTGIIGVTMSTVSHTLLSKENHDLPRSPCTYNGLWEWQMFVNCFCFKKSTPRTRRHQSRLGSAPSVCVCVSRRA